MLGILPYFWRLVPGNPILLRVIAIASKRKRDLITRCGYLGLLIAIVLYALVQSTGDRSGGSLTALAKTSASLFQQLAYLQLALVALLAPVFTAGAITQERDSQTYDVLLATPLTNGQIVLGTLLSRVFFVVALLVSGIPIFSITQIFGGVAIGAIAMSFLIAASTALVTGALAIAIATLKVGSRRTIFSFYLFIAIYLVGGFLVDRLDVVHPTLADGKPMAVSWLTGLHPFLALRVTFNQPNYLPPDVSQLPSQLRAWPLGWYFTSPAGFYVTFMLAFSLALVIPSIALLRMLAQTTLTPGVWLMSKVKLARADRTRAPRAVWSNPIAWREAKTKGSASRAVVLRWGFAGVGLVGSLALLVGYAQQTAPAVYISDTSYDPATNKLTIYDHDKAVQLLVPEKFAPQLETSDPLKPQAQAQVREFPLSQVKGRMQVKDYTFLGNKRDTVGTLTLVDLTRRIPQHMVRGFLLALVFVEAAVILLVVTNTAASTVTREKEDGTLDLLLTTPITSRYYVWGKLRGMVYFALPLIAVPSISVGLFIAYDAVTGLFGSVSDWTVFPEAILLLPVTLTILAAFAGITGMNLSLRCRTSVRAVMFSVAIVLGACGLLGFCGQSVFRSGGDNLIAVAVSAFSPFTVLMLLVDPYGVGGGSSNVFTDPGNQASARTTLVIFGLIATTVYAGVVWTMYKTMVKNFDMTIRKQSR